MRKSCRCFIFVSVLVLIVLAAPRPGAAFSLGLKFSGGYSSINGGDINEGLKGGIDAEKTIASYLGVIVNGDYKPFHGGLDFGGDVILYFTPVIGLGFGAGMITARSASDFSWYGLGESGTENVKPDVKVIPLRVALHFSVPMGSYVNLTINGGAEYHLAKLKITRRSEYETVHWDEDVTDVESKGKIGFVAGLGLEIRLHPNFSLLLEGRGRYARIDGFSGSERRTYWYGSTSSGDGDLWYVKINYGPLGQFPIIGLNDTPPPSDPMYQDARSARLSLDGFVALAGIMIRI